MQTIFYFINCHLLSFCFLSVIFRTRFGYDGSIFSPSKRKFVLFHIITNRKKNNGFGRWRDGWDAIDKKRGKFDRNKHPLSQIWCFLSLHTLFIVQILRENRAVTVIYSMKLEGEIFAWKSTYFFKKML